MNCCQHAEEGEGEVPRLEDDGDATENYHSGWFIVCSVGRMDQRDPFSSELDSFVSIGRMTGGKRWDR